MKKDNKFIVYLILFLSITGCSQNNNENYPLINLNPDVAKKLNFKDWCTQIKLVPLETNSNSVIADCHKIMKYNNRYFILDVDQRAVFAFNKSGKYLFSTKNFQGKGPNEYISLTDFNINYLNKKLEILDPPDYKIKIYDLNGKYNRHISLSQELLPLESFKALSKDIYLFYTKSTQRKNGNILFYSIKKNKIVQKVGELPKKAYILPTTMRIPFHNIGNKIHFNYTFPSNSIYCINQRKLNMEKLVEFDFGKYNFTLEDLPNNRKKDYYQSFVSIDNEEYAFVFNIIENETNIFIHFYLKKKIYIARYEKSTKKTLIQYMEFGSLGQLPPPNLVDNNYLYYVCEPGYVKYYLSDELLDTDSKQNLSDLNIDDNPVIIKYKLQ